MRELYTTILLFNAVLGLGPVPFTYIKLNVTSQVTQSSQLFCANLQLFDKTARAVEINNQLKKPYKLFSFTSFADICKKDADLTGLAVYKNDLAIHSRSCGDLFYNNLTIELSTIQDKNASIILIPERHLHASFQSPSLNINGSFMQIPFIYVLDDFMNKVQVLNSRWPAVDDVTIQVVTLDYPYRYVMLMLMLFMALISVALGGAWSGYKTIDLLHNKVQDSSATTHASLEDPASKKIDHADRPLTYCSLCIMMTMIVILLMSLYYFYDYLVWFVILVYVHGSILAVYACLSLIWNGSFGRESCGKPEVRVGDFVGNYICCCIQGAKENFKDMVYGPKNFTIFLISVSVAIAWFVLRKDPYSFIWHDLLAMVFCIYLISSLRLHSLKWLTLLFTIMFIYDLFMVFISPLFTSGGCSIMIEAVTGGGCSRAKHYDYAEPLNVTQPADDSKEQIPVVFRMMDFMNPLIDCFDFNVDKSFPMMALGFGDVIIPGLLVGYNHAFDIAYDHILHPYYLISLFGYTIGIVMSFSALELMGKAQPALIYLVPCLLLPTFATALVNGEFMAMWRGELVRKPVKKSASRQSLSDPETEEQQVSREVSNVNKDQSGV